jgi:hypothetical protein
VRELVLSERLYAPLARWLPVSDADVEVVEVRSDRSTLACCHVAEWSRILDRPAVGEPISRGES